MPPFVRQAQHVRLGLLQMLQPIAQVRPESQPDFHCCPSETGGPGLMTIARPMIVHTRPASWQISSNSCFEVMFFRRTVTLCGVGAGAAVGTFRVSPGAVVCTVYVTGYEMTCVNLKCCG